MRFALYASALIVADAILRANWNYTETEMYWLAVVGGLFLIMDLSDFARGTWDWVASKNWRICSDDRALKQVRQKYFQQPRYDNSYRGPIYGKRSGS